MAATSSNGEILNRNASGTASGANSVGDSKSSSQQNSEMKGEGGEIEMEGGSGEKAGEYVRELLQEKQSLDSSQWPHALRLLDQGTFLC
ncbi:hypothetical protein PR048_030785 [Dryococelus australis]|uniref:Uncharacterized protein n=1 Tax=Dryococelus australis TaxID=614101 RepID=A0ABQ9G9X3_9NEOP|nr:hypothetical protein PR048_030785 [Dryococelus australis]